MRARKKLIPILESANWILKCFAITKMYSFYDRVLISNWMRKWIFVSIEEPLFRWQKSSTSVAFVVDVVVVVVVGRGRRCYCRRRCQSLSSHLHCRLDNSIPFILPIVLSFLCMCVSVSWYILMVYSQAALEQQQQQQLQFIFKNKLKHTHTTTTTNGMVTAPILYRQFAQNK